MSQRANKVALLIGSDSDWAVMETCYRQLREFDLQVDVQVLSAHRSPDDLRKYVQLAEGSGIGVFITGAGMSAALPGVVSAHTTLPVIGVPLESGILGGLDALLSMVQMPPGVPVGTVAISVARARFWEEISSVKR